MGLKNIVFCAKNGLFDVRHYMIAGTGVMALTLILISQTSLQARVVGGDVAALNTAGLKIAGLRTENTTLKTQKTQKIQKTGFSVAAIPHDFKMNFKNAKTLKQEQGANLTRLASLQDGSRDFKFSPKNRKSCSLEGARAAANGDPSKMGSCIDAFLSGDPDELVKMPEKMSAFFIEAMNDPNAAENFPKLMMNSMMQMMEAMSDTSSK